ncbi:MAG: hypothetical protein D6701_07080, partial [Gemmatimonadetes bacterium]
MKVGEGRIRLGGSADARARLRRYVLEPVKWGAGPLLWLVHGLAPARLWALDRPVFIVGCPRSGTTAFARLAGAHPDVVHWSEAGQVFQRRYYDADADHELSAEDL